MSRRPVRLAGLCALLVVAVACVFLSAQRPADQAGAQAVKPTAVVRAYVRSQNPRSANFHLRSYKVNPRCRSGCVYAVTGSYARSLDAFRVCNIVRARVRRIVLRVYWDTCLGNVIRGPLTSSVTLAANVKARYWG